MHDDHFLVLEAAQAWVDNSSNNNWLPWNNPDPKPSGHSFFYVGMHFLILYFLKWIGFTGPQGKMYIVRLLHALFSLLTVFLTYRITLKISDKKTANRVGLLHAVLWFMPFLSVRNLVEVVCIPFMLFSLWKLMNTDRKKYLWQVFVAGFIIGLGVSVRFQVIFFACGAGLVFLLKKQIKECIIYGSGLFLSLVAIQGTVDFLMWGRPFAELTEYIRYNLEGENKVFAGHWYQYMLLLGGILLPPVSIFILAGYFLSFRKHLIIFLPALVFIVFHSYFPNKQERFILPVVPFVLIAGMCGWNEFISGSAFWKKRKKIISACWVIFWTINTILLLVISVTYTKKSMVESMSYLSKYVNINSIVSENTNDNSYRMLPLYYLGQWPAIHYITQTNTADDFKPYLEDLRAAKRPLPDFILFFDTAGLVRRIQNMKILFPGIQHEKTIHPGFIDDLMRRLNPNNKNYTVVIYSTNEGSQKN